MLTDQERNSTETGELGLERREEIPGKRGTIWQHREQGNQGAPLRQKERLGHFIKDAEFRMRRRP